MSQIQSESKSFFDFKALDLSVDEGQQEIVAVVSADVVDREGDVLVQAGLKKKQYQGLKGYKNHVYSEDPSFTVKWLKRDGDRTLMKAKFFTITPEQQLNWEMVKHGVYDQWSVGFMYNRETASPPTPQELKRFPEWQQAKRIIREWEPYEVSFVGIPANQNTMTLAVSKGFSAVALKALEVQLKNAAPEQAAAEIVETGMTKKDFLSALAKQFKK